MYALMMEGGVLSVSHITHNIRLSRLKGADRIWLLKTIRIMM
jgi:hypothetical protein